MQLTASPGKSRCEVLVTWQLSTQFMGATQPSGSSSGIDSLPHLALFEECPSPAGEAIGVFNAPNRQHATGIGIILCHDNIPVPLWFKLVVPARVPSIDLWKLFVSCRIVCKNLPRRDCNTEHKNQRNSLTLVCHANKRLQMFKSFRKNWFPWSLRSRAFSDFWRTTSVL